MRATAGAVPVPLKLAVCGVPGSLSETDTVAVLVPVAVGVNVTLIVQDAPAASELPQLFVWAKSELFVPVMLIPLMKSAAVLAFDKVIVWATLVVWMDWFPKEREPGDRSADGAGPRPILVIKASKLPPFVD